MKLIDDIQKEKLNNFLSQQTHSQFLQSWQWGELAEKESAKVTHIGIEDEGELVAVASLIKKKIFGFSYWFCPRGPVIGVESKKLKVESFLFDEISSLAKKEGVIFLRFEPELEIGNLPAGRQGWKLKIVRSIDIEPSKTAIVNLQKTEDELLTAMHQKTRYNVRLAEKKGVTVRTAGKEDFDSFWRIMKQTEGRDNFRLHSQKHYRQIMQLDSNFIRLLLAEYQGKVVAAVLASFFGDTITYIHGASSNEHRNVMAPYLLHWQIIKSGKAAGYKYYDLNGVDEKKWPGVTRFKIGFGGEIVNYPGTFDFIFNKRIYNTYKMLRFFRRMV